MLLALSGTVLVSCTQSEFVGENVQTAENNAISFGGGTGKMTRANITGGDAATKLGDVMLVNGAKKGDAGYKNVFVNYQVKYDRANAFTGNDEINKQWYYVFGNQTIKYWDYASTDYRFVAGSPVDNFTFNPTSAADATIATADVTGLGGRLNRSVTVASDATPVYIADPVVVAKANYKQPVTFAFKTMQSKVRVGIYETIPGDKITAISFYNNEATPVASQYITLNSATDAYFQGASAGTGTGTVTYAWTATSASYTFAYDEASLTTAKYWEGGKFTNGVPATTSAEENLYGTEDSMGDTGYFNVMPTPSATVAVPLTLTCDYTLTALDNSGETINVKGAKATIPADYTKWAANTAYTYIFKITDNTNGTTGDGPEGLFPITFDAAIVNVEDATQEVGTETTLSTTLSITVSQDGNVVENGITYKAGDVVVTAMEGTADVTSAYEWSYVALTSFDYTLDYEKLGENGAATTWTSGKLATVEAGKTYVIKASKTDLTDLANPVTTTAYFVLVVGAAEECPANP